MDMESILVYAPLFYIYYMNLSFIFYMSYSCVHPLEVHQPIRFQYFKFDIF